PLCSRRSKRVHSRYERTLADLPWGAYAVAVRLRVRRLFCRNTRCDRRIFTERLPRIVLPWARRTRRLDARLTAWAWRLAAALACALGPSSDWPPAATHCCAGFGKPPYHRP